MLLNLLPALTNIPNPRRKKKTADGQLREHVTGCARSEGYYAISRKEKDVYLELDQPVTVQEVGEYDTAVGSLYVLTTQMCVEPVIKAFTFLWVYMKACQI